MTRQCAIPAAPSLWTLHVVRGDILIPSVSYRILDEHPDIGYIQLTRFSGESSNEIHTALVELQAGGAQRLILDLRHNGGGLLDAAVDVADHFLQGGPVMIQQSRDRAEQAYEADAEAVAGTMPLAVLVDGGTASSAEIVAGALQDHERAILVGSQTFGKGSVQLVYDLSDGSSVHVTSSRWYTPDYHQIDEQGLTPDVPVEVTQEAITAGRTSSWKRLSNTLITGTAHEQRYQNPHRPDRRHLYPRYLYGRLRRQFFCGPWCDAQRGAPGCRGARRTGGGRHAAAGGDRASGDAG